MHLNAPDLPSRGTSYLDAIISNKELDILNQGRFGSSDHTLLYCSFHSKGKLQKLPKKPKYILNKSKLDNLEKYIAHYLNSKNLSTDQIEEWIEGFKNRAKTCLQVIYPSSWFKK